MIRVLATILSAVDMELVWMLTPPWMRHMVWCALCDVQATQHYRRNEDE